VVGRLQEAAVTICEECGNGRRRPALRARAAERDGRTALVLGVPVEVCDSCGQVWMTMDVAKRLDELFATMLASDDVEVATRHFESPRTAV
jgi:YgiT-type zinc finger domain-containing protein